MAIIIVPEVTDGSELTSYATLISTAESMLGRSVMLGALTTSTAELNRRLRVREMLVDMEQSSTSIPSDFLEAELMQVGGRTYQAATVRGAQSCTYAVKDSAFVFTPTETSPDVFLRYYAKQAVPTASISNVFLEKFPDLYLYALLTHHSRAARDESGAAAWAPSFEKALNEVVTADTRSRMDSAPLRVKARATA